MCVCVRLCELSTMHCHWFWIISLRCACGVSIHLFLSASLRSVSPRTGFKFKRKKTVFDRNTHSKRWRLNRSHSKSHPSNVTPKKLIRFDANISSGLPFGNSLQQINVSNFSLAIVVTVVANFAPTAKHTSHAMLHDNTNQILFILSNKHFSTQKMVEKTHHCIAYATAANANAVVDKQCHRMTSWNTNVLQWPWQHWH